MKILHIETSSKNCSVAISENQKLLALCEEASENFKQSETLHTFIAWALEGAEIALKDLDAVSVGAGPGSYTGLRIGAASAKGFCFSLGVPLLAINSMETMVQPFLSKGFDLVIPMLDARRMEVYTAQYDGETGEEISLAEAKILQEDSFQNLNHKKIVFVGDGAEKASQILDFPDATFIPSVFPSAQFLVAKAVEKFNNKDFEDVAYFNPLYLKEFQGNKMKK